MTVTTVKGHTGLISMYKSGDYMPIACLNSTSMNMIAQMTEKTNYCTEGRTVSKVDSINTTVNLSGEVIEEDSDISLPALREAMQTKEEQAFKIEGRGDSPLYFKAVIANLGDTFPGDGDATFDATFNVNGDVTEDDPNE